MSKYFKWRKKTLKELGPTKGIEYIRCRMQEGLSRSLTPLEDN